MNRDPFSIFSKPLDLPQAAATHLAPEPEPAPRGEPLRPERDPFDLLLQLRPHYSDWLRIPADELHRSWRPGPGERLFVQEGRDWVAADSLLFVEPDRPYIALRKKAARTGSAGAPPRAASEPAPAPTPLEQRWPPSISVSFPETTGCAHDAPCGCRHGPVNLETCREVEWRGDTPWLEVSGWSKRAESVTLEWQGPTRGSANVPVSEAGHWATRIPVKPGEYRITATATGPGGSQRRQLDPVRIIYHQRIVDIAYDTGRGHIIAIPEDLRPVLREAAEPLEKALRDWLAAQRNGKANGTSDGDGDKEKARTESELRRILKNATRGPLGPGGSGKVPSELVFFREKRWRYVSDPETEKRLRRAPRVDARAEAGPLTRGGKLDTERLYRRLQEKLRDGRKLSFDYGARTLPKDLNEWAEGFNAQPEVLLFEYRNADGDPVFRVTDEARMMRMAMGVSANGGFDLDEKQATFHGAAQARIDLLEGKMGARLWLPSEQGHDFNALVPVREAGGSVRHKPVNLCRMRAMIEANLTGYAGASACTSLDLEFDMGGGGKAVVLRGAEQPGVVAEKRDRRFKARASRRDALFAGIRGGAEVTGRIEWDNPDSSKGQGPGWETLGELGAAGQLQAGLGLEREYAIVFDRGKFHLLFKASAAFGVGCGGEFHCQVGYENIGSLLMHVYQQLMREDFDKLLFVQELAFKYLYRMHIKGIWEGVQNLQVLYSEGIDTLGEWWDQIYSMAKKQEARKKLAERLANHINAGHVHLDHMAPETRGYLLRVLCHTSILSMEESQEEAIIRLLDTIFTRREFRETLEHMTYDGSKITEEEGRDLLEGILDGLEMHKYRLWKNRLAHLDALNSPAPYGQAIAGRTNGLRNIA